MSWTGAGRSGTGISLWDSQGITVQNVTAANRSQPLHSYWDWSSPPTLRNRYLNNNLSNADWGLTVYRDSGIVISNVDFSDSNYGLRLIDVEGVHLDASIGSGFGSVTYPIELHNVHNSTVTGLDVSWAGEGLSGTGIWVGDGSTGNSIAGVQTRQRGVALDIHGDSQIQIADVDFSNSYYGLRLYDVDSVQLNPLIGSGLQTTRFPLELHNVHNSTVTDFDLSWDGDVMNWWETTAISVDAGSTNNRIANVNTSDRGVGLNIDGDNAIQIEGVDFSEFASGCGCSALRASNWTSAWQRLGDQHQSDCARRSARRGDLGT